MLQYNFHFISKEAGKIYNDVFVKHCQFFSRYADRQNQLNLEAVEIGDKEAEESPMETDDEEPTEESISLTKRRKDGLKKLLHKKSKKGTDEKESSEIVATISEHDRTQVEKEKETENKESNSKDGKNHETVDKDPLLDKETDPLSSRQNVTEEDPLSSKPNVKEIDSLSTEKICNSDIEKIHSLSDDSNKIDSDIDELHLLQKLHSDVFDSSTLESSDSESPIAISDTLSSGDDKKQASDVISIENSSYSESERNNELESDIVSYSQKKVITECVNTQVEIECSDAGVQRIINKSNNDEYNESVEDILLASSDDEANDDKNERGDPFSMDETNVKQSIDENIKDAKQVNSILNADTTDASSMESIEMTAAEVTSTNSIKMVVDDTAKSPVGENAHTDVLSSVKLATVEDTKNENDKDKTMTFTKENTETVDEINTVDSAEDSVSSVVENKNLEVSTKLTESVEDKKTSDKSHVEIFKVNSEVKSVDTAVVEHGSNNSENNND